MPRTRQSFESGHHRKFLVVIDETPECDRAVYFACRRAMRVGAGVVMLRVIETQERNQQWLGVADIMKAEAHEEANASLERAASRANGLTGITAERVVREGKTADEILGLIEEDEDIAILVLAAAQSKEGPGPLVSGLSTSLGDYPIPVAIVPGHLTDEELDSMT
jgi:nucleotide-binding universal stress UspA family protein